MEWTPPIQEIQKECCESQVFEAEQFFSYTPPHVYIEYTCAPLVVCNDCTFTEFVQGEERCLKFISQDLTFLQSSSIPSTFSNISNTNGASAKIGESHTQTALQSIQLPTQIAQENSECPPTQTVEPVLGFTLAEIRRAQAEPKLTVEQLLEIESFQEYVKTPLQTLDGIYIHQPKRFLPLAKEAKKLAETFKKEQVTSQWAGIPHGKLLQELFVEQLNSLQTLEQLVLLKAAKEHLCKDIINILELLGKADNIPFNQLYSLAEDCADRYYTKVINTLTQLLKRSFNDRQLVLVNTARALKFLESYGNRRTKLWKVLSKYDRLLDHFHDLQTTLQTKFNLLKKATAKNIENLHNAVNLQQTYTMSICSHVNSIYSKPAQLDRQIQTHCLYPHSQSDIVQLNAPEYDSDIDGQTELLPDIQPSVSSHTENTEEASSHAENTTEDPAPVIANSKEQSALPQDSDRLESQSQPVPNSPEHSVHQDTEQSREDYQNSYRPQLEDILELEDDKENWEKGQFADADLIDHHNTTTESDPICWEYSAHFVKSTDQGYNSQNNITPGLEYYIPEPEYYSSDTQPKQYKMYQNLNVYLPPPPSTEYLRRWYGRGSGRVKWLELHSHRLYDEKTRSLESRIACKWKKNQRQWERKLHDS